MNGSDTIRDVAISETEVLIELRNASLKYPVGSLNQMSIKTAFLSPLANNSEYMPKEFEALKSVSLTVKRGDRLGIIGHNGAGKSTILRAIAGIYPLHSGQVLVNGEIQSLFDIGVGFDPEESGRNNIYHRGYLLGYTRRDIEEIEQEVIEFSGVGEFIDMPVKTFSTGMQVRLAFAVSTALGGSILLIDEVLSAGDAEFALKAHARMKKLIDNASCLVLVSHDMGAIKTICNRALLLDDGNIAAIGDVDDVISKYLG